MTMEDTKFLAGAEVPGHSYISGSDHEDVVIMLFGLFLLCYQLK